MHLCVKWKKSFVDRLLHDRTSDIAFTLHVMVFNEYDESPKRIIIGTASRSPHHSFGVVPREIKESVPIGGLIGDGKPLLRVNASVVYMLLVVGSNMLLGSNNASEYANLENIITESNVSVKHILHKIVSTSATGISPATSIESTSTPLSMSGESLAVHVNDVNSACTGSELPNFVPTVQVDPSSVEASSDYSLPAMSRAIQPCMVIVDSNFRGVADAWLTLYILEKGELAYSNSAVNSTSCFTVMPEYRVLGMRIILLQKTS
uniref:Uncharacterized protein n=1 Tax=Glossina austeni TaxID=7395 RepID=A0A1A9UI07_GLOAU